jgi:hypothetical protein
VGRDNNDCAVFVTHVWTPEIAQHYRRLKREAGQVLDVFLVYQQRADDPTIPSGMQPDLVVRFADSAQHFPLRYQEFLARPRPWGYVDLVWITAFLDPKLERYDRFWLVEYDVDFSGDWSSFFAAAAGYEGDLLATRLRPLSADPEFGWASLFNQPSSADTDPLIAFMPISRVSRELLHHYCRLLEEPGWQGHFEMLLPSIARMAGFTVAEIGGHGAMTPPERRGLYYEGTHADLGNNRTTHGFRPPRGYKYFVASPKRFRERDRIYHPIKANLPLRRRLHYRMLPLIKRWHAFLHRIRGQA